MRCVGADTLGFMRPDALLSNLAGADRSPERRGAISAKKAGEVGGSWRDHPWVKPALVGRVASPQLARWISNATRMLAVNNNGHAAVVLTLKWDQRFESAFLQRRVRKLLVPA
jgi:hypothetical protein